MTRIRRHPICLGLLASALALAGCGPREVAKKDTYPAAGRLLLRGQPALYVKVTLEPEAADQGMPADGVTDGEGRFTLRTYANEGDPDGAVPGRYKVVLEDVRAAETVGALPKGAKPTLIPDELRGKEVTVEIKAEDNDVEINVE